MYDETSIQSLIDRIGWSQAIEPSPLTVDAENATAVSGRFFDSFHVLNTAENVYACISNLESTDDTVNEFMYKMKRDSVLEVLNKVFDLNPLAYRRTQEVNGKNVTSLGYAIEYDAAIVSHESLFDEAIGYSMTMRCLSLFLTTKRLNLEESSINLSYEQMKLELEGMVNEYGKLVVHGTVQKFNSAINRVIEILFPTTTSSTATIRGVSVW